MVYELANMSWNEALEKFKDSKIAIVPTGANEQHGLHLGTGADWIQAETIAKKVGEKTDIVTLPVVSYGVSSHHKDFPGTIFLKTPTFEAVIYDILSCLNRYGIKKVIFVNGHGGNLCALEEAIKKARDDFGMICAVSQWWDVLANKPVLGQTAETHAGYAETSLMIAARPEAVKMEYAVLTPTKQVDENIELCGAHMARFKEGLIRFKLRTADVSDTGSMTEAHPDEIAGTKDFSKVTPEFSNKLMDEIVDWLCDFTKAFEKFELPPIEVSVEKALKSRSDQK